MSLLLAHNEETVHKVCSSSACEILPVCMQVKKFFIVSRFVFLTRLPFMISIISLLSLSLSLSLCLSLSISISLSIYLSLTSSIYLYLSISLSIYLSLSIFLSLSGAPVESLLTFLILWLKHAISYSRPTSLSHLFCYLITLSLSHSLLKFDCP